MIITMKGIAGFRISRKFRKYIII